MNGQYLIKDEPPLIYHYDPLDTSKNDLDTEQWKDMVRNFLASMPEERRVIIMQYRSVDIAQKVVGVGSVGTRCSVVLCLGEQRVITHCSCRSKKLVHRCSSSTWGRVRIKTMGSGWW